MGFNIFITKETDFLFHCSPNRNEPIILVWVVFDVTKALYSAEWKPPLILQHRVREAFGHTALSDLFLEVLLWTTLHYSAHALGHGLGGWITLAATCTRQHAKPHPGLTISGGRGKI